ncbi:ABC transporter permease [Paenibacillus sp. MMS20-IR301]|uniref:YhgE/Pip domain-containing protein n=1 Tax=Paenibacillus sp. MMS20-IR301 TaxID=2895946 RepID=UPI0028E638EB|nr:ABC transporter permease [Paenibacillus sp. MMS20-IR301]WNS46807.1 DUF3533 domain-containing protein [Paenibacillus sp. MMS20-IR301]
MFKNKLAVLSPIIALLIVFIFSLTLFPSVKVQPKNLPIAIVNEDQGIEIPDQAKMNFGQTIIDNIQKASVPGAGEEPAVKWVPVDSLERVQQGLNDQEYYAALVIPADFSTKQASLSSAAPASPEIQILINQGMNMAASTAAGQILNGVVDNINANVRTQILAGFKAQGGTLTVEQAAGLATPIIKQVANVNETGTSSANGNSPISLFQPLWMASLASAAILFLAARKTKTGSRKEALQVKLLQIIIGAVVALAAGFGLSWLAGHMVGIHIPAFMDTALFLSVACFSFFLMITAVMSLVGMGGIALFTLMLFFGAPLLALAPEMMSSFYRDWIHPWLPMRFMVDGLRKIFFFGEGLSWNASLSALIWIGLGGMLVILVSVLKPRAARDTYDLEV